MRARVRACACVCVHVCVCACVHACVRGEEGETRKRECMLGEKRRREEQEVTHLDGFRSIFIKLLPLYMN